MKNTECPNQNGNFIDESLICHGFRLTLSWILDYWPLEVPGYLTGRHIWLL